MAINLFPIYLNPSLLNIEYAPVYLLGTIIGSLFPDIDEPRSAIGITVGKYLPFIPVIINSLFGHRGLTHIFIFFLIPFITWFLFKGQISNQTNVFIIAFLFGILGHHLGDMLSGGERTKGGIKDYFWPITRSGKYITVFPRFMRCTVWDYKEKIYHMIFILLIAYQSKVIFWDSGIKLISFIK